MTGQILRADAERADRPAPILAPAERVRQAPPAWPAARSPWRDPWSYLGLVVLAHLVIAALVIAGVQRLAGRRPQAARRQDGPNRP